ncbi:hypothetical protein TVAG_496170 [Trichomonas vaginalis G3]|uniref:Nucleotide-diphospho-sugar transferase domain-containing protein n=1 Tax=Trichomonas vaginalis (strain ATCC PRA-98 / G3) TaxID=412133 RepID=A2FR67_TRIV3|nr:hypothetical protein TVAGG3_0388540 [Trichomonas vaginalis G3]EAX92583.1 hypothetical protein TVAG_496170 [Trichomonas vaginalis G3]KAI5533826.1 hypothetical protein TVAGG3_0388540 [Trichomonas vaginalis G3]|eukprot:XP_001305513.1 hypothetical protein [Trichomonas vaginalis G3]
MSTYFILSYSEYQIDYIAKKDKCNRCDLTPSSTSISTNRDMIITTAFNKINNFIPFINSLRTFNNECRILVITDRHTYRKAASIIKKAQCGVEFLIIPYKFEDKIDIWFYRWAIIGDYLLQNQKYIDNVIQIDLFDTIFQSDPFSRFTGGNIFYLCHEDANYYKLFNENVWVQYEFENTCRYTNDKNCPYTNYTELIMNLLPINAGMEAGNVKNFIKFTQIMRKYGNETSRKGAGDDQHYLTFSMALGHFKKLFKYKFLNYSNDFMLSGFRYYIGHPERTEGQKFGNWSVEGKVPAIYHQFDRSEYYVNQIRKHCHLTGKLEHHVQMK